MGTVIIAFKAIAPLFLAIFAGMVFSNTKSVTLSWVDILNKYALKIGLPSLVIASLLRISPDQEISFRFILINSVYFVSCMLLAYPVARILGLPKHVRSALFLILSYGNVAYLGCSAGRNHFVGLHFLDAHAGCHPN
jgi:predicted permease